MLDKNKGFTLIELMIAVAVVGILTLMSVAGYKSYTVRVNRSSGVQAVQTDIQFMEQQYLQNGVYSNGVTWPILPIVTESANNQSIYKITFTSTTANKYTYGIIARPLCSGPQKDDGCICGDKDGNILINAPLDCSNSGPKNQCSCL